MIKKRIKWLDFAKGFTIFFVILAHCVSELFELHSYENVYINLLYCILFIFIMPTFFAISGYLYKRVNTFKNLFILFYKKIISLLLPYFFISVLTVIGKRLLGYKTPLIDCILGFKATGGLWFLPALFIIFMIVGVLDLIHIRLYMQMILFIILIVIQSKFYLLNKSFLPLIYMTVSYAIFFYLGFFIRSKMIIFIYNYYYKSLILEIILFLFFLIIEIKVTGLLYASDNITYADIMTKVISVFLIFNLSIIFSKHKIFQIFTKYGKYTLIVYLLHHPTITIIGTLIRKSAVIRVMDFSVYLFIIFILTTIIMIVMCHLCEQYKYLNFIFYPRKYINKLVLKTFIGKRLLDH